MGRLTAIVLGSAAGGAFPQWNCRCPVCALAWVGDSRVRVRTQAGIAVTAGDGRWTLINASPDLGQQIRATSALHPQTGLRGSPIDAVVLTGAEIDQIAGLLSLRESTPFTLYATPASHVAVATNPMFSALSAMTRRAVNPGERFVLAGNIEASLFMVPGKLPLYLEGEDPETGAESAANVGIELQREGARLVFVPGAAAVTPAMRERFARADAVLFDGTLFTDDEMLRSGTGQKTGRRMGHIPIDGEGGTLRALDGLAARRSLLLAGTIAGLLLTAPAAFAQQPPASAPPAVPPPAAAPASALPPGSPLIGRPEGNQAAAKLAPVAAPPLPAAADKLPTAKLKLPPGFNIEVYASGIANARSLRIGDKGTVFVGTRFGNKVTAVVKKDGKTELKTVASGLYRPNGLAYHNGTLYIAELSQISKIDNIEAKLDNPPAPTVIYKDPPKDEAHGWKFIAIGPDNKLYGRSAGQ